MVGAMRKIKIRLERLDADWPPVDVESVWATLVDREKAIYRVANIPFFAWGISFDDLVRVKEVEGERWFREVVEWSGHSTVRVLLYEASEARRDALFARLKALGCGYEGSHLPQLVAVNVPPGVYGPSLQAFLDSLPNDKIGEYEEANIAWASPHSPI